MQLRTKRAMVDQQHPQPQEMNDIRVDALNLPPGFRFHPSDYEIVNHYLINKVHNRDFASIAVGEVDLKKAEPWDLPRLAKMGEKEWYFFYKKDRKYPTGMRANRATEAGYWKATGKDKEIYDTTEVVVRLIGMKKTLVFYKGRAPRGEKTNWVMHEYRLEGSGRIPDDASASSSAANTATMKALASASKDEWVVCRVFEKTTMSKKTSTTAYQVAMVSAEIEQNQNNIPAIHIPMPLQLPLPVPMQFPIIPELSMDPVAPYYSNTNVGMSQMMSSIVGIGGASELQINSAPFGKSTVAPPQMNFDQMGIKATAGQMGMSAAAGHMGLGAAVSQMGMRVAAGQNDMGAAVAHMGMGAAGAGGFNLVASESRPPSSMVSQKDEQANAAEISSLLSVTGPGSSSTTIEMDGIWNYEYWTNEH